MPEVNLTLSDWDDVYTACRLRLDRDLNAAQNVLQVGTADLPGGMSPVHSEKVDYRLGCQAHDAEPSTGHEGI